LLPHSIFLGQELRPLQRTQPLFYAFSHKRKPAGQFTDQIGNPRCRVLTQGDGVMRCTRKLLVLDMGQIRPEFCREFVRKKWWLRWRKTIFSTQQQLPHHLARAPAPRE